VAAIATGADDVDEAASLVVVHLDEGGGGQHGVEEAAQLVDGLPFHPQGHDEAG
jgi:hypothetical protein